jgi:hypothetical protein
LIKISENQNFPEGMQAMYKPMVQSYQEFEDRILPVGLAIIIAVTAALGVVGIPIYNQAMAQNPTTTTYFQTNLKQLGVPNFHAMKPYKVKYLNLTDKIEGKETKMRVYDVDNIGNLGIFSINGKIYGIALDDDKKSPLKSMFVDQAGKGKFTPYNPKARLVVPGWAIK